MPDEEVTFDGTSSDDPDGSIDDYDWDVETSDGYSLGDSGPEITYTWETGGTYDVTLTVTDADGTTDSVTKSVVVENSTPVADFSYSPSSPVPDETVTLDGTSSNDSDGSIDDYDWEVETSDGYSLGDSGSQINYTWETGGTYDVTLTVTDNGEATDSVTETIVVGNTAPTADFSYSPSPPVPDEEVSLDGTISSDFDGSVEEYDWEVETSDDYSLGDSGPQITYTWETGGTYDVTLTVTDNGEQSDSVTKTVVVGNSDPVAEFSYSSPNPVLDEEVTIDGTGSSDSDGSIDDYDWEVETSDGYSLSDSGPEITYTWETGGTYDVTLTVTDNGEATNTVTETVVVANSDPVAEFSHSPSVPISDETVTLDGTPSSDSDGSVEEYDWEVETSDGYSLSDSGSQITYAWESEGAYDVTLTVTDNGEKTHSVTEAIAVGNTSPTANVSVTPERPDVSQAVTFTGSDSRDAEGNIDEYAWTIAGSEKHGEEVTHVFDSRGEHVVELTVTDTAGAADSTTVRFFVGNRAPSPSVSHSPTDITTGATVTFDASESNDPDGSIAEYLWTFPDGTTATGERVEYSFDDAGSRTVELALTDDEGRTTRETLTAEVGSLSTSEPSPSRSGTAASDDRPEAPRSTPESQDDRVLLSLLAGAIGLGGAGITYRYWSNRRSDAGGPDVVDVQEHARQTAEEADDARRRGEYETAIDAYEEAIAEFERAKQAAKADGERSAAITGSLAETREKLADTRERKSRLDAVREPLRNAESGLETAIARHARDQIVVARRDYRQAKNQYEQVLNAIDEGEADLFDDEGGITVPVNIEATIFREN